MLVALDSGALVAGQLVELAGIGIEDADESLHPPGGVLSDLDADDFLEQIVGQRLQDLGSQTLFHRSQRWAPQRKAATAGPVR